METSPDTIDIEPAVEPEFTLAEAATGMVVGRPGQLSLADPNEGLDQISLDI